MKKHFIILGTVAVLSLIVGLSAATGFVQNVLAQVSKGEGGMVADLLLQAFRPNPNLLVEDHAEISCEPNFSVKVLTPTTLKNAKFKVKDAATGAVLFGPKVVDQIYPLWQKVWLGPLSYIPPKIFVDIKATTSSGTGVEHRLILEPDCKQSLVKRITVLHPIGKILTNPLPPLPDNPNPPRFIPIPDIMIAAPQEAVGKLVDTIVRRADNPTAPPLCMRNQTIETEIVSLSLQSCQPIQVQGSFLDVFVEINLPSMPNLGTTTHFRLIDATPLE